MRGEPTAAAIAGGQDPITDALARGDAHEAVALAARHHGARLGRFCMALLGNAAEAEEAVQDAFVAAFDAFATYRGEGSVRSFLFGIARHVCAKKLATRVRRDRRLALVHDADAVAESPHELVERRARAHSMRLVLEDMRPTEREALLLRYEAELSFAEVGEVLGVDEATARKRVSRALVRLRELCQKEGMS
jgi:RNA polymerase sigma-70 factor (ECF subfamily)